MERLTKRNYKLVAATIMLGLANTLALAQDSSSSKVTTRTTLTTTETWYAEPWVWIVGVAVFIILIVALTRGSRSSGGTVDKVTYTKKVSREDA